jgi:Fatty acid synthase type I helical domain
MNHISEEQLVLLYYGESTEASAIDQHLVDCEECRTEFRALKLVLNTVDSAPVPERSAEYGHEVWQRIEKRLGRRKRRSFTQWWMWAPAMATLVLAAFLAGRLTHKPAGPEVAKNQQQIRERILLVAVGDHLERSQMVLAELTNAPDHKGKLDITDERQMAADLLDDNRLYRQTAHSTGDTAVAGVLDDLERVLLEIAHSPTEVSSVQLDDLRQQIESRGLLFKVRVMGSQAREQEVTPAAQKDKKKL